MRKVVLLNGFESDEDEINFFKVIKPQLFGGLIYFIKLFNIESKRPRSSSKFQLKFLNYQINKHQDFFNEHMKFYKYYRRGLTSLDREYFLRGSSELRMPAESYNFYLDEQFSKFQDSTVAMFRA